MKKYIFLLTVLSNTFFAQKGYDKNVIEYGIYLNHTNGILNYSIDKNIPIRFTNLSSKPLYASAKGENVNVLMQFVNPLKLSYEVTYSSKSNPDLDNLLKFMTLLTNTLNVVGFPKALPDEFLVSYVKNKSISIKADDKLSQSILSDDTIQVIFNSKELYELGMLVIQNIDCYARGYDYSKREFGSTKEDSLFAQNFEKNLRFLAKSEVSFEKIRTQIRDAFRILIDADTPEKANVAYEAFKLKLEAIKTEKLAQQSALRYFDNFYDGVNEEEMILNNLKRPDEKTKEVNLIRARYVKNLRKYNVQIYKHNVMEQINVINSVITNLEKLGSYFESSLAFYIGCKECDKGIKVAEIPIDDGDIKEVELKIVISDISISDDLVIQVEPKYDLKGQIYLKAYTRVSVDLGTGLLYAFDYSYDKYSTIFDAPNNNFVVTRVQPKKSNILAGTMLNIIFKTKTFPVFPMLQLGFGTNVEIDSPVIFAGGGLKFIKNLSLSGGILTGWYKELDKLKVGDVVNGDAELKDDYKYTNVKRPSFYIGIQYSF